MSQKVLMGLLKHNLNVHAASVVDSTKTPKSLGWTCTWDCRPIYGAGIWCGKVWFPLSSSPILVCSAFSIPTSVLNSLGTWSLFKSPSNLIAGCISLTACLTHSLHRALLTRPKAVQVPPMLQPGAAGLPTVNNLDHDCVGNALPSEE